MSVFGSPQFAHQAVLGTPNSLIDRVGATTENVTDL